MVSGDEILFFCADLLLMYYDIVCQHEQICERRLGDGDTQPAQNSLGILSMSPYLGIRSKIVLALKAGFLYDVSPSKPGGL